MALLSDDEVGLTSTPALASDSDVGLAPPAQLHTDADVGLTSQSGETLSPQNYGRVAAARIALARRERLSATNGQQDLNQNEQAAIMDTYRQAAGLKPLSSVNSFQESQKYTAEHQSDLLNLARSTASAFERQGVNFVAPVVDTFSPEWGKQTREDIAAMNPFDPKRITGKAGGPVASLPLLLAGGSAKAAAAVFGLNSATESLATSEDTGIEGFKKWGGAASAGAITAGSVLLGGKLGEWATKGLAAKMPQLAAVLATGDRATAGQIIAREAAQAGINLPIQGSTMLAGTIADNLAAQQTTDPNRKWSDGLGETAFNVAAMTITNHIVRAADSRAVRPAPSDFPDGRVPSITKGVDVPNTAGSGVDADTVYTSKAVPDILDVNGKAVATPEMLALHEKVERQLEDGGMSDDEAHARATAAEHNTLRRLGIDPKGYEEALAAHEEKAASGDDLAKAPPDLDIVPYNKPVSAVPDRPASVVSQERDIEQYPDGHQVASPHLTYDISDRMSPLRGQEFGPSLTDAAGENVWVRPSGAKSNADRQLLVQFSTHLINAGRERTAADDYYDKLYANRPGYSRPTDFWELPQWIGVAAKNLPNADVYVVRNLDEAKRFLEHAKYGHVAMSALDVNTKLAQGLISDYKGKVAVGGYTDMAPFAGRPNVKVYKAMPDFIKDVGRTYEDGTDYRHFKGTEVVPRLSLSEGCLHNCDFCGVEGKGKAPREIDPKAVEKQIESFGDLNHKLVYINDKTFWQAKNSEKLPEILAKIKARNPGFEGFIVQTSAAMLGKVTPEMIRNSGVKYVEMGVESYNNDILRSVKKPANEKMIDDAVQTIRKAGAKFIPNIMTGLPGETPETYARTLDFLNTNRDVISHVNAYNVALYRNSELSKKVGGAKSEADADENVTRKSWQADPAVDQAFHDQVMAFGAKALDTPAQPPAEPPQAPPAAAPGPEETPLARTTPLTQSGPQEAMVPPRPPNEPPPREPGGPAPDEPEGRAGSAIIRANLDVYTGDTRTIWDRLGDAVAATWDGVNRFSGRMFPTLTRLSRPAGEKAATYISSKIWAVEKASELARNIVGTDPELDLKLGVLLSEDQLRSLKARALKLPGVIGPDGKFSREQLQAAYPGEAGIAEALRIQTFIGKEGSPFRNEQEYQAALRDPRMQEALQRVKAQYGPVIDELFRKAQNLAPDAELAQRGLQTGIRTNLMARDPGDKDRAGMVITGSPSSSLRNPMRGKTPFSRQATGTGQAYEGRMSEIIKNSLGRTADTSFKNDFIQALKDQGVARSGTRGQRVSIGKYDTRSLPLSASEDLFIRSDAYNEVRGAFDVDSKVYNDALKAAADLFNRTALASTSEAAYHIGNQISTLMRSPGTGLVVPRLISKTIGLLTHDPAIMAQVSELAKAGAWRTDMPETPTGTGALYKYTLGMMGRIVGKMDQAGRLVLDDTFKSLAKRGIALNTDTNRRDFVNQLGQYNRRAQSRLIALARDTGVGPFATAGTNFYAQGIRSLVLSPGLKATSVTNAARLRVMVAGRFAAILGGVALVNFLRWGRVDGGEGVPIGAIRLDDSTDEKGRPSVRYFDVANLMNITRGLRAVGARALIEGPRQGKTNPEIAKDVSKDIVNAIVGPFMGPIARTAEIAATGESGGFPVGPAVAKDENAPLARLKAAALSANPVIAKLTGQTRSSPAGKFSIQERAQRSVAQQIATREAAARVPAGQQTREEMDQTAREHALRKSWAAGDTEPLISAYQAGQINKQRADALIKESAMSDLARTVHHLPIETSLRVFDAGTPAEKADLYPIMLMHLKGLIQSSPLKAQKFIEAYQKRGLI